MNSSNQIPELEALPPEQRKRAWSYAYRKMLGDWMVWLGFIMVGLCVGIGFTLGDVFGSAIGGGIGGIFFSAISSYRGRPHVQDWCKQNGYL